MRATTETLTTQAQVLVVNTKNRPLNRPPTGDTISRICAAGATYNPTVTVTETKNGSSKTAVASCPMVTCRSDDISPDLQVSMFAAPTTNGLNTPDQSAQTKINVGQTAAVRSVTNSNVARICGPSGEYAYEPESIRNSAATYGATGPNTQTFTTRRFDTPGTYKYKLACRTTRGRQEEATATIVVVKKAVLEEI